MAIRLVTFDALHTLVTPRLPIYMQYSQTFEPYLGALDPDALKRSFRSACLPPAHTGSYVAFRQHRDLTIVLAPLVIEALKQLQQEQPVYRGGAQDWWADVIRRTAVGAGADPKAVDHSLEEIVPRLLARFSSREGYRLFDDSLPTLKKLKELNIRTGLISNTDARMRAVIEDLEVLPYLDVVLLSEEEGVEKPSREIFQRACEQLGINLEETVHVGDELDCDYQGAIASGVQGLLLRRPGPEGEGEHKERDEDLSGVQVVPGLSHVLDWIQRRR